MAHCTMSKAAASICQNLRFVFVPVLMPFLLLVICPRCCCNYLAGCLVLFSILLLSLTGGLTNRLVASFQCYSLMIT
jgi:hypothetical protein